MDISCLDVAHRVTARSGKVTSRVVSYTSVGLKELMTSRRKIVKIVQGEIFWA